MLSISNMPVIRLRQAALQFSLWLREGLGIFLPEKLRLKRWRTIQTTIHLDKNFHAFQTSLVQHSWVGATRNKTEQTPNDFHGPLLLSLPAEKTFKTTLSLPNSAKRNLKETVRLRLGELSPVPPEQVAFAVLAGKSDGNARFHADILLAKRSDIEVAASKSETSDIFFSIGHLDENGKQFVFNSPLGHSSLSSSFRHRLLLMMGVTLCLAAFPVFLERQKETLTAYQQELIRETKTTQATAEKSETIRKLIDQERVYPLGDIFEVLAAAEKRLPETAMADSVVLQKGFWRISGYLPESPDNTAQGVAYPYQLTATNRLGVKKFSTSLSLEGGNK